MTLTTEHENLAPRLAAAGELLARFGQQHLLEFSDRLNEEQLESLLDQIDHLDVEAAARIVEEARGEQFDAPPFP